MHPAALHVDGGNHGVPTEVADMLAHDLSKTRFIWWQLPDRKCVDVDDANLLVRLDDPITDDPILAAWASGGIGAARLAKLSRTTACDEAQQEEGRDAMAK